MNDTKRKKSIFTLFLAVLLLLFLAGALAALSAPERTVYAETAQTKTAAFTPTKFTTTFSGGSYTITGFDTNDNAWTSATVDQKNNIAIVIPAKYNDNTNGECFVTAIGDEAFLGTKYGSYGCTFKKINLSQANMLESIGAAAFSTCTLIEGVVTIPNSVTTIGDNAFYSGQSLETVYLPNAATFGTNVFYGVTCPIVAPSKTLYETYKVTSHNLSGYGNLSYETAVTFDANGGTIGAGAKVKQTKLYGYSLKYEKDATTLIWAENTAYTLPAASKDGYKFNGFNTAQDGSGDKVAVTTVVTDASTYYAQYELFMFVTSYSSVKGGYTIEGFSEKYIDSLTDKTNISIVIPATYDDGKHGEKPVVSIGYQAFDMEYKGGTGGIYQGCVFTSLDLSGASNLKTIGGYAFNACTGITGSLAIPNFVTTIGNYAFSGCGGFDGTLTFLTNSSFTSIGNNAFYKCKNFAGNLTIPNSVTEIGDFAFSGCSGFNDALTLPTNNDFTAIGNNVFNGCSGFTGDLTIPDSVITIGTGAFLGCSGFTGDLTIPNSVTTIGTSAFGGCSGFSGKLTLSTNNNFTKINSSTFSSCGGFTGALTIPSSVTTIGEYAFYHCSGFTGDLTIPNSVTTIGEFAFDNCKGFNGKLTLPTNSNFTTIGFSVFNGCSGFTGALTIPNSVTNINNYAFSRCTGLKTVYLPNNADGTTYGSSVFSGVACPIVVPNADLYTQYKASGHNLRDYNNLTYEISVTFDANGGTVTGTATQTKLFNLSYKYEKTAGTGVWAGNNAYALPSAAKTDFTFAGWNTKSDGTGSALDVVLASVYYAQYAEIFTGLEISGQPGKTSYLAFEQFNANGLTVYAVYQSGNRKTLSASDFSVIYTGSNTSFRYGDTSVTISYTENETTKTASVTGITVEKIKLAKPTVYGTYTYTGAEQTVTLLNFNEANITVSNNTRKDAGKQNVEVSLKDATNYGWSDNETGALSVEWEISKVKLTPSVSRITSKPYDGTTDATGTIGLYGAVNEENPTATATFVWTSANAGTTTVHVSDITLGSGWTTNYALSATTLDNQAYSSAKISKVTLMPWVSDLSSKNYDGTTDATGTIGLYGAFNEDNPTATATFVWTSANAGTTTVNVSNITLGSNWTTNYELSATTLDNKAYSNAKINKAVLIPSVSGITSKAYDGTTDATGTIGLYGAVNEENPTATGTFVWTSANAGTNTVNVSNITLGEGWDTNYKLSVTALGNQSELYAEIKKVTLTPSVSGITSKTYDGNISAEGTITLTGAVNNESPTATATFVWTSRDAGTTTVHAMFLSLADAWEMNYKLSTVSLSDQSFGDAKINYATITNSGAFTDYSNTYDKTAHTIGFYAKNISVVNSQNITVYYSTDQENWKTEVINYTDFTDGAKTVYWKVSAPNHTDITGSNSITIAKKAITVTADDKSSIHKADLTQLTYTVSPTLCSGDVFTGALATNADKTVVGEYDVTQGTLSAGNNYDITFEGAKYAVIAKQTVIITQTAQNFTYDGEAKAFVIAGTELGGFTIEYFISSAYTQTAPVNAGSYQVKVTRDEDANRYAFGVEIAGGLVIAAQKVAKPDANTDTFIYTGSEQTYTLTTDGRYTVTNAERTDAGSQTVTVALKDKSNYEWTGGGTADVDFTFTIGKATARISVDGTAIVKTYGDIWVLPQASSNFGTVDCDKVIGEMRNVGSYTVTYSVLGTDNYDGDSKQISVTIIKQKVAIPHADTTVFVEDGNYQTYEIADDNRYTVNGNVQTATGSYTVTVTLNDIANYEWSDGTTAELSYSFIVRRPQLTEKIDENAEKEDVIVTKNDGFAPDVTVEVTVVPQLSEAREAVAESEKVSAIYDVKLLMNGAPTQPDGTITIRFLIPDECVGEAFRLLHIHGGEAIETDYTIDGDYVVVTTDRLSEFVFVSDNTGSILWLIILFVVLLLAEAGLAAMKLRKNKKDKKEVKTYSFAPLLLAIFIPTGEIATVATLGALVLAGGVYNAYLWFFKKNKPQNSELEESEPVIVVDTDNDDLPEAEVVAADDMHKETEAEVFKGVEKETGLAVLVRYKKSFTAKLIQSPDETKNYYGALKNAILSYKKATSRVSWNYDSVSAGRTKLAKFGVKGKTLYLYLALDADDYLDTQYKAERAESKKYADTPCLYKIKNDRRAKYALDLIAALAENYGLIKGEERNENFYLPYETTDALIEKGLIKELISKEKYEDWLERREQSELDGKIRSVISASEADAILRDEAAAALITKIRSSSAIGKREKAIVNIDSISEKYRESDIVNLKTLKEKGLIGRKVNYFKVLARGKLDKPLTVEADEFSIEAVKMILLTGGKPIKISR